VDDELAFYTLMQMLNFKFHNTVVLHKFTKFNKTVKQQNRKMTRKDNMGYITQLKQ